MESVHVKKVSTSVYQIVHCPKFIEEKVWGHAISIGKKEKAEFFHFTWLEILQTTCLEENIPIIIEG